MSLPFPVVALGASAGGLAALEGFFGSLGPEARAAYVVVTHLHPEQHSMLPELLARSTPMPVTHIVDGVALEPGHVYVAPPAAQVSLADGVLHLSSPPPADRHHPIDFFLRTVATDCGERAVCVILSGSGADGVLGLRQVKEHLGTVLAQDPGDAEFDGMPRSAIDTGLVDTVLPVAELAGFLGTYLSAQAAATPEELIDERALASVLARLCEHSGHDFSLYKRSTVERRLQRRLLVHHLDSLVAYDRMLAQQPEELDLLFRELLIGVTRFFRDGAAYEALAAQLATRLADPGAPADRPVRAWVAGSATGEEAYSVAIVLLEILERLGSHRPVQVFATDIDPVAIATARTALYPGSIALDVSPERLRRYFQQESGAWRVRPDVREVVVFAVHSLVKDPPFHRLDLVTCRNVLIYMEADLQRLVLPTLAYSLEPGGLLFLGASEGIGTFTDLFEPDATGHRLHRRAEQALAPLRHPMVPSRRGGAARAAMSGGVSRSARAETPAAVRRALEDISPPAVVVDLVGEIHYVSGRTGRFLELAPGETTNNLYRLARPGLQSDLTSLVRRAHEEGAEVTREALVREEGGALRLLLRVRPVDAQHQLFLVVFEPAEPDADAAPAAEPAAPVDEDTIGELQREVVWVREILQSTIEDLEAANEELAAANEELMSTNEELQSTNEELETSREELQSLNEELHSLNEELSSTNQSLVETNSDLRSLLNSTAIATLFLDRALRIKRFTEPLGKLFNLLPTDIDRPVAHLTTRLRYDRLVADAEQVLDTLIPLTIEVQDEDDGWHVMRILPRRTTDDVIVGLVVTLAEITEQKRVQAESDVSRRYAEAVVAGLPLPLAILDEELRILSASPSFHEMAELVAETARGRSLPDLAAFAWFAGDPERRLQAAVVAGDREVQIARPSGTVGAPGLWVRLLETQGKTRRWLALVASTEA